MGIYTRDQIQYANMIQNAMQNRARAIEREGDNIRNTGALWGGAVKDIGSQISNIAMTYGKNQMANEKLQAQQDFQAEQAALRNKEAMERLGREQAFQAQQNQLNRDNTLAIAQNRFEQGQAEKMASDRKTAMTDLEIQKATVRLVDDELGRTDDPQRIAELNMAKEKAQAKMEGYYRDYPDLRPAEPQVPHDNPPAGQETPAETQELMQSENLAKFSEDLSNSKTIADTEKALSGLRAIDTSKLDVSKKEALQKAIADGEAKLATQKKAASRKAEGQKKLKAAKSAFERRQIAEEYGLKL